MVRRLQERFASVASQSRSLRRIAHVLAAVADPVQSEVLPIAQSRRTIGGGARRRPQGKAHGTREGTSH